jgi:hypothetical protein
VANRKVWVGRVKVAIGGESWAGQPVGET